MTFQILGLATALPRHSVEQARSMELAKDISTQTEEQRRLLAVLYRRTGVKRRHSVLLESPNEAAAVHSAAVHSAAVRSAATSASSLPQESGSELALEGMLASTDPLAEELVTQSFYPPAIHEHDGGPSTSERMERYAMQAGDLAVKAAAGALAQAEIAASEITHLVTVSCTGFRAPGVDLSLIRGLGLPASTERSHIGFMGCHGALNGLRLARAYGDSNPRAVVLMVAVELCSLHHQYGWQPDRVVANALFADGAAAVVGRGSTTSAMLDRKNSSSAWNVVANGSQVLPDSEDVMSWRIGDHGFEMTLSPLVPDMIRQSLKPWLTEWLAAEGYALKDVGSWAIHPGGPRILSACEEALGLNANQLQPSRDVLAQHGNMSSPTVLFILHDLIQSHAERPIVALAFGPGLSIEAMLLH